MPKTQSALLEAMAEQQVTIDGVTRAAARRRSSCSRPRTRSSRRGHSRCPRPSSTASSCGRRSATRARTTSCAIVEEQRERPSARARSARRSTLDERERVSRAAVEDVYIDPAARAAGRSELVRATRDAREGSRSAPPCAAASRSSAPRAPGRCSHGRDYVDPDRRRAAVRARARCTGSCFTPSVRRRAARRSAAEAAARDASRDAVPRAGAEAGAGARGLPRRSARLERPPRFRSIPRRRVLGPSVRRRCTARRRGLGSDVAGSRPYRPGDERRRSTGRPRPGSRSRAARDEFIVREHFAEEAPRVVVLCRPAAVDVALPGRLAVAAQAGGDPPGACG